MEILYMLSGAVLFIAGFATCFFIVKKPVEKVSNNNYVDVKRVKPSMRNPLRTYDIRYDKYKAKDTELFQPVRPKRKSAVNEVDTDG